MRVSFPENASVIDATNLIAGRMASQIAKRLLKGETIVVVNAEKVVFSGSKKTKLKEFKAFLDIVGRSNPEYGPRHPRRPDTILRRVIRGMLPRQKAKGREAYRRLKVYIGAPLEIEGRQLQTIEQASAGRLRCSYISLDTLAREIGWKGVR